MNTKEEEIAATMTTTHPAYASLAARISVSNLHKNTLKSFSTHIGLNKNVKKYNTYVIFWYFGNFVGQNQRKMENGMK